MDPNDIAAMTKSDVIQEHDILPGEENHNQTHSEQESEGQDQEEESEETYLNKEAEVDLIQEQQFNDNQQTRTQSGRVLRPVFK